MKSLKEVLENYENEYEVFIEDRFGSRLCDFLTVEQAEKIGFLITGNPKTHIPLKWTEDNILRQLKEDVEFGWEKCISERGISSCLMGAVVRRWCKILENGLEDTLFTPFEEAIFKAVDEKYSFGITGREGNLWRNTL